MGHGTRGFFSAGTDLFTSVAKTLFGLHSPPPPRWFPILHGIFLWLTLILINSGCYAWTYNDYYKFKNPSQCVWNKSESIVRNVRVKLIVVLFTKRGHGIVCGGKSVKWWKKTENRRINECLEIVKCRWVFKIVTQNSTESVLRLVWHYLSNENA